MHVGGCDLREVRAGGLAHDTGEGVLGDRRLRHRKAGVHNRSVDDLPFVAAPCVAPVEREQDAFEGLLGGERVAKRDAAARRRLVGVAIDVAQATHRLTCRCEADAILVAAGLAIARDARIDQPRILGHRLLWSDVPFLHRAGAKVFEGNVGLGHQLECEFLAFRYAQVERDNLFIACQARPPERVLVDALAAPFAHRVALRRRLDFDDLGAKIAKQGCAIGSGQELAELDRADALEGASVGGFRFVHASPLRDSLVLLVHGDASRSRRVRPTQPAG